MAAHLSFRERDEFTRRLKSCLKMAGLNPNSPTQLLKAFLEHSSGLHVSQSTVYKWLIGDALPDSHNMEVVAKICKVCPYWLRTGHEKNTTSEQFIPTHAN
ncbi:MAG: helix-turn-helix domain-containing protein [Oxalobacteraceae bacterium]